MTLIPGGRFGFGVATEVLFSKFVLHVPLYRQQDMWAQSGWSPSRSTLGQIVTVSAGLFRPLADRMRQLILATTVLGTDDTPVTLLTPGVGKGSREADAAQMNCRADAQMNCPFGSHRVAGRAACV